MSATDIIHQLGMAMDAAVIRREQIKLCINCAHHRSIEPRNSCSFHSCLMRIRKIKINPVTGEEIAYGTNCTAMRRRATSCGPNALLFEDKK